MTLFFFRDLEYKLSPNLSPGIHDSLSPLFSCFTLPPSRNKLKNYHYQFNWSRIDLSDGSLKFSYNFQNNFEFKTTGFKFKKKIHYHDINNQAQIYGQH